MTEDEISDKGIHCACAIFADVYKGKT